MTEDNRRVPPHYTETEEALLGAMLLSRQAIEAVSGMVVAGDFYTPRHALVFDSIMSLYNSGDPVDPVTVADHLQGRGVLEDVGGPVKLIELQGGTPSTSNAATYAKSIAGASVLRRVIAVATEAATLAYDAGADPDKVVQVAQEGFAEALSGQLLSTPQDLWILDEFLDRPVSERPGWIIPGLLRRGWRAMLVAGEGSGKTVLFRQIGIAAGQGIHPLSFENIPPVRVLIVDLENPDDSVVDVCEPLRVQAAAKSLGYDGERIYLWHRPGGINLRSRRDRIEFETVVATARPDLVVFGPIYKCYSVAANENDELAAKEVMQCFDDLRTRYGFALMLEHHAPKASGAKRDLSPYGTSLWLRWPELGISLTPVDALGEVMKVGRWRGDRMENEWPLQLERGKPWLWQGKWETGHFNPDSGSPLPVVANGPEKPSFVDEYALGSIIDEPPY